MIQKMPLTSMNISEEKRKQLKMLFPEVFSEDKVNFDKLRAALGDEISPTNELFGLTWAGKAACMSIIQQPTVATLKPSRDESVNFDDTENLFIEGDNLEVLKLLQRSYFGKVKMIYIDPPYNTGKEFIYPDKFGETLNTYLAYTGQIDGNGHKFSTNTDTNGRLHSKWLNMMYPRLYLARNLLRDDGVIFISIDDHEQSNLKALCDQVFGEENFVTLIAWQGLDTVKNDAKYFSNNHEYILCFAKHKELLKISGLKRTEEHKKVYKNRDNDPRGPYLLTPLHAKSGTENNRREYTFMNGFKYKPPSNRYWRYSFATLLKLEEDNRIFFPSKKDGTPQNKTFLSEVSDKINLTTFWDSAFAGSTRQSNNELTELLSKGIFPNSKPAKLINIIADSVMQNGDTAIDFFAGSATTAHAIMQLNAEDNGNRKYICVQLPEPCDKESEALKAGYKTIADISKERIRRAIQKIGEENPDYGGDLGFKALKLSRSNFKEWGSDAEEITDLKQQLEMHINHIMPGSTEEDILYELLLKSGLLLTTKIDKITLAGKKVYVINDGELIICLDMNLTQAVIDAIAEKAPHRVICLDAGFRNDDQLKVNAVQAFQSRAQQEEREIVFSTV